MSDESRFPDVPPLDEATSLDLTAQEPTGAAATPLPVPHTEPYSVARKREDMRGKIAISLVTLFAFVVIAAFVTVWVTAELSTGIKDLLALVLGPVAALVGSATGYYFGGQSREDHAETDKPQPR